MIVSGTISIRRAIQSTEANLVNQLPVVTTTFWDWDEAPFGMSELDYQLTAEVIREVGALSYVESYDFSMWVRLYSRDLSAYADKTPPEEWGILPEERFFVASLSQLFNAYGLEVFIVEGVNNTIPIIFQEDILGLIGGRTFTEQEIEQGGHVVLISDRFAEYNDLTVGSTFILESMLFDEFGANLYMRTVDEIIDNLYASKEFEVEVIGIFEINTQINPMSDQADWQRYQWTNYMLNQIFAPLVFTESAHDFIADAQEEFFSEESWPIIQHFEPDFILHDPRDLQSFATSANQILPGMWSIEDLSGSFDGFILTMETMTWIADQILIVGIGATIVILGLMITLFLRNRRHEIGTYLALGERKSRVIAQFLIEFLTISIIAITFAVGAGNIMANTFSRMMIENHLVAHTYNAMQEAGSGIALSLAWHNPSVQDLLEMYDTSLTVGTIAILYAVGTVVILISTIIPVIYITRLNPKEILMEF